MTMTGAKKGLKKPTTEEILQAKVRGPIHIYIIQCMMYKKQHTRRYELYTMGTSLPTVWIRSENSKTDIYRIIIIGTGRPNPQDLAWPARVSESQALLR